ncbi:MAG: nuclear transport factor 2 family protein [Acidobacteria bacterium]|nr:nuclear transport factor 2 family protein [Acidobacteriota bacterium]
MKTLIRWVAAGLLAACTVLAQDSSREFKQIIQRYWQAWSTLNPDNAAPFYAKNPDAVFFDVAPLKYTGWEEYKEGFKKAFAGAVSASLTPNDDLKVTARRGLAWTTNTFQGTIQQRDGKSMKLVGRHTAIWEKRGGKWIILHEHASAPLPE